MVERASDELPGIIVSDDGEEIARRLPTVPDEAELTRRRNALARLFALRAALSPLNETTAELVRRSRREA